MQTSILKSITKFRNHPSIKSTNVSFSQRSFSLSTIEKKDVDGEISKLYSRKAIQSTDIAVEILKKWRFLPDYIYLFLNGAICLSKFLFSLTSVNINSPVSILPVIPKIFEKLIKKPVSLFSQINLSKFQCSFRKEFSTQHCFLLPLGKWKNAVGNHQAFDALLSHLPEAFNWLNPDFLIANLVFLWNPTFSIKTN